MAEASIRYVEGLARLQQPTTPGAEFTAPEAALRELLRGHCSHYGGGMAGTSLAPFQAGRVSLPEPVEHIAALGDLLSARGKTYLEGEGERMREGAAPPPPSPIPRRIRARATAL